MALKFGAGLAFMTEPGAALPGILARTASLVFAPPGVTEVVAAATRLTPREGTGSGVAAFLFVEMALQLLLSLAVVVLVVAVAAGCCSAFFFSRCFCSLSFCKAIWRSRTVRVSFGTLTVGIGFFFG